MSKKKELNNDDLVELAIETAAWNICTFLVFSPSHTVEQLNHVKAEIRKLLQAKP